jgi:phosphoserine phosphatase
MAQPMTSGARWGEGYFGYRFIFFDCDSTLSRIEGIDELARMRGVAEQIARLTHQAMNGETDLEEVYAERLRLLTPTRGEMRALARRYSETLVEDARELLAALLFLQREVFIISGGLAPPVKSFGRWLGLPAGHIRAVNLQFDQLSGAWWEYGPGRERAHQEERYLIHEESPLAESQGKAAIVGELLADPSGGRSLLVGDGVSDLEARDAVDLFVGFGGVVFRERVAREADVYVTCPTLAPILPIAATPAAYRRCRGTQHQSLFDKGLSLLATDVVAFRSRKRKEILLRAYGHNAKGDDREP